MKTLFLVLLLGLFGTFSQSAYAWPVICIAQCTAVSEDGAKLDNGSLQVMASANSSEDAFRKLTAKCKKGLIVGTEATKDLAPGAWEVIPATIQNACIDLAL